MACEYSKNEWRIIDHYGFRNIAESSVFPTILYPMMCCRAFLLNDGSKAESALRRGMKAIEAMQPHRLTPEFESLIAFEKESQ